MIRTDGTPTIAWDPTFTAAVDSPRPFLVATDAAGSIIGQVLRIRGATIDLLTRTGERSVWIGSVRLVTVPS
jgi:hypothetical protein